MIVVDASLAVKWILWERDSRAAIDFLRYHRDDLHAPDLLFTEVAQAIVRRHNEGRAAGLDIQDDAREALHKWTALWADTAVQSHRLNPHWLSEAGLMAMELGHPLQDRIYLALARELSCDLATCDAKFRAKAVDLYPDIRLLSDYDLPPVPILNI